MTFHMENRGSSYLTTDGVCKRHVGHIWLRWIEERKEHRLIGLFYAIFYAVRDILRASLNLQSSRCQK